MNGWIKVSDRMPEENERVICYGVHEYGKEEFYVAPGYWFYKHEGKVQWSTLEWDGVGGNQYFRTVTHWQPLPVPPTAEGKEEG
jgi:hypothetical protein